MQNKENGFGRFVKEKGYYIVLLLCAVAIGVSGYLLLSGKNSDQQVHLSTERATVPPGVRATEHALWRRTARSRARRLRSRRCA